MAKSDDSRSMVDQTYVDRYETARVRGPDGKLHYVRGNQDAVSRALTMYSIVEGGDLTDVAETNGVDLLPSYHNAGGMRMALGNRLRAILRKNGSVIVGEHVIKSLDQRQPTLPVETGIAREPKETKETKEPRAPRARKSSSTKGSLTASVAKSRARSARRSAEAAAE